MTNSLSQKIIRQCAISKKRFPRASLSRLVKIKDGHVFLENMHEKQGRSLYFSQDISVIKSLFSEKKKKMVEHFLKTSLSDVQWREICEEALKNNPVS